MKLCDEWEACGRDCSLSSIFQYWDSAMSGVWWGERSSIFNNKQHLNEVILKYFRFQLPNYFPLLTPSFHRQQAIRNKRRLATQYSIDKHMGECIRWISEVRCYLILHQVILNSDFTLQSILVVFKEFLNYLVNEILWIKVQFRTAWVIVCIPSFFDYH